MGRTAISGLTVALALLAATLLLAAYESPAGAASGVHANPAPITVNDGRRHQVGNADNIAIPDDNAASPATSAVNVSGLTGVVTDVDLDLRGINHTFPADLDIMLEAPNGARAIVMSDAGGDPDLVNHTLNFSDDADNPLPANTAITGSVYKPTNYQTSPTDAFTAPSSLSALAGISPNGTWKVYAVDDQEQDVGNISNGFLLTLSLASPATPYPSTVNVSGRAGVVTDVDLTLTGVNHTRPADLDVMLRSPNGTRAIVMSDAGSGADLVNRTLTFSDEAPDPLPQFDAITADLYRPTNHADQFSDAFPGVTAAGAGSALSAFDGASPNGVWSLHVVDDSNFETGSISGGFSLNITTNSPPAAANDGYKVKEDRTLKARPGGGVLSNDRDADGDRLSARRVSGPKHGTLTLRSDGSFAYKPKKNFNGTDRFVYEVRDGKGGTDRATVSINVRPVRG